MCWVMLQVWVAPFQWSFPLNLPPQFFGIFAQGELLDGDTDTPWGAEIEQKVLLPPPIGECGRPSQLRSHDVCLVLGLLPIQLAGPAPF
jgi:hypothetical protein